MQTQDEGSWEIICMVISDFFVGLETDEGIREDLARSVSSAWIGLHPKQTKAGTQANSIEGEVSSLMKGCEVSSIIMVQLQVFVLHL